VFSPPVDQQASYPEEYQVRIDSLLRPSGRERSSQPFALLRREGRATVEVLVGPVSTVDRLADLPVPSLAVVPYRQVAERGFACVDDGTPLAVLAVERHEQVPVDQLDLPDELPTVDGGAFDIPDARYAEIVRSVLRDEIGQGEGSNFVIHRVYEATTAHDPVTAALAVFKRLLSDESGAYWTFLVHTGDRTLVGATPERHVSVDDGLVLMNPISGTYRHDGGDHREGLLRFLADRKEIDELMMVLDEELKMMATVADLGGQVLGPYLKEMAHLTHTEYLLAGRTGRDVRDVLRETMFAPTVVGSPIENACRVIARHERRGRGYYGGVLALLGPDGQLDAPILIRTAEFLPDGRIRVPVGATLVRHSTPESEVAETHAKAAGVLAALGLRPAATPKARTPSLAADAEIQAALVRRNATLAPFWLQERDPSGAATAGQLDPSGAATAGQLDPSGAATAGQLDPHSGVDDQLRGRRVLIVDAEDTFTGMLTHQLRVLGLRVDVRPYHDYGDLDGVDLVVPGPGPGDPRSATDPKMVTMRSLVHRLLAGRTPQLAVCLGHQILAGALGLRLRRKATVYQGIQCEIDLFGRPTRVGFYSTFAARATADWFDSPYGPVQVARDPQTGDVHALRGNGFAGVQFHPESVLSEHGIAIVRELTTGLLGLAAAAR
jgi:phenazine biosynthesis protein phzE